MSKRLPAVAIALLLTVSALARTREFQLLVWDPPRYPIIAAAKRVQGTVKLRLALDSTGRVHDVQVLSGHEALNESAVDAARKMIFECAACQSGQPVTRTVSIRYEIKGKPTVERRQSAKKHSDTLIVVTVNPGPADSMTPP